MSGLIYIVDVPPSGELMRRVVDRIKNDASQFHEFKRFLDGIPGLDNLWLTTLIQVISNASVAS